MEARLSQWDKYLETTDAEKEEDKGADVLVTEVKES